METLHDGRHDGRLNQIGNGPRDMLFQGRPLAAYRQLGFGFDLQIVTDDNKRQLEIRALPFEEYVGYDKIDASNQIQANIVPSRRGRLVEAEFVRTREDRAKDVGKDVGVVIQSVVDISAKAQKCQVLDIGVKSIDPKFRDADLGTLLLIDGIVEHPGICWVTGQSRNGRVFSYLEKVRELRLIRGVIWGYEEDLRPEDIDEILKPTLSSKKLQQVNRLRTGLLLGIYAPADPKLFTAPPGNEKAIRVVDKLKRRGVMPGGPNGIRYLAEVDQDTVKALREEYRKADLLDPSAAGYREGLFERLTGLLRMPFKAMRIKFFPPFR